ncbi:MAG: response regulator, partial [Xanthobacteraceae bacterium]
RAAKLTGQLLAFARRQALKPEVFEVGARLRAVADMLDSVTGARIRVVTLLPDEPCHVRADLSQFETALINMAVNARDAMGGEGTLTLRLEGRRPLPPIRGHAGSRETFAAVSLTDTGAGIPSDALPHIFEPFFTTKEVGKGTGLGLSMIYGFVKQSGGHARIYSEVGVGTVVRLYLPRSHVPAEAGAVRHRPAGALPTGGETILLVEDDPLVRKHTEHQLVDLGYRVVAAENAAEALDRVKEGTMPDLLFTDIVMPGSINGRELADQLRARWPHLKVLYTSGFSHGMLDTPLGGQAAPQHLLAKPFRRRDLATKVREVLDEAAAA